MASIVNEKWDLSYTEYLFNPRRLFKSVEAAHSPQVKHLPQLLRRIVL